MYAFLMNKTCLKKDRLSYHIWNGLGSNLPKWLTDSGGYRINSYVGIEEVVVINPTTLEPTIVKKGGVFVQGTKGSVRYFEREHFDQVFTILTKKSCCLRDDVMTFYLDKDTVKDENDNEVEESYVVVVSPKNDRMMEITFDDFKSIFTTLTN